MIIKAKNTKVLAGSLQWNVDKSAVLFQANTTLYVDGNPYTDMDKEITVFDLQCAAIDLANIDQVASNLVDIYVASKYPAV